jgi:hypothetical protein
LKVVKKDKNNLSPAGNVIIFNEYLHNYTEENEKIINKDKFVILK